MIKRACDIIMKICIYPTANLQKLRTGYSRASKYLEQMFMIRAQIDTVRDENLRFARLKPIGTTTQFVGFAAESFSFMTPAIPLATTMHDSSLSNTNQVKRYGCGL